MDLQVSQQLSLRAERLVTHSTGEVRQPVLQPVGVSLLGRLKHLITPAAAEHAFVQVGLLVIGQAGQVVELLVTLATMVDGAGPVAALVRQQLGFGSEDGVALEAGVAPGGAGLWEAGLWRAGLWRAGLFLVTIRLNLKVHGAGGGDGRPAGLVGPQVTDDLRKKKQLNTMN